ncbi:MAG: hypothetical protein E5V92_21180 [Mesorhizobium sp.]|nr:hypothetical protein EJ067_15745 [Mesorhizobium sp. M1D.F.Ca.ET.043.01.1.1]RWA93421.1 MAG: hypothetical protein EOQ32_14270 [Mesorhizobium sp.]RWE13514.1 MAG: hypothetical protein EOS61_13560 [Mesorhizobium sp.]TJW82764.1 MAG: hypothetical protein E5V92_21180 [Mesorhizobium sp.]
MGASPCRAPSEPLLDAAQVEREIRARDMQLDDPFSKDMQVTALRGARTYLGDKLIRTAKRCASISKQDRLMRWVPTRFNGC